MASSISCAVKAVKVQSAGGKKNLGQILVPIAFHPIEMFTYLLLLDVHGMFMPKLWCFNAFDSEPSHSRLPCVQ